MKIVYLTSEAYPFFKTGGLADVMFSLPKEMSNLGHEITLILPKYKKIPIKYLEKISYVDSIELNGEIFNLVEYKNNEKIRYLFIENRNLYERDFVYGDMDEDYQYAAFNEVILMFMKKLNMKFDIVHCNDWQTGPFPYFLKTRYKHDPFFWDFRVVYTIHNLMYQGKFNNYSFDRLGYFRNNNRLNFMELGISYSDIVNTVSKSYAKEITYPYFAEGLEWLTRIKDIYGVVNGIDNNLYDPKNTKGIIPYNDLVGKKKNKSKLQEKFGLEVNNDMVISLISRLVEGKGLDLIVAKIEELLKDKVQIIFLGTGSKYYEDYFRSLEYKYPNKFKTYIGYNEEIANLIYAGSDLFLMPSRYEPCGLSQLIAMRYGTIPLVRSIGGLKDTVLAYNIYNLSGNGFSFDNFNADDMLNTIRYAEYIYYEKKENWNDLVIKNMNIDNSWNKSAKEYEKLYDKAKLTP